MRVDRWCAWVLAVLAACGGDPHAGDVTTGGATTSDAATGGTTAAPTSTTGDINTGETTSDLPMDLPPWDPPQCGESMYEPVVATPPSIALVIERSGSMVAPTNFWDHDADDPDDDGLRDDMTLATAKQTRWRSVFQAVASTLVAHDEQIDVGLALFPAASATAAHSEAACPVDGALAVPIGPMHAGAVVAAMPAQDDDSLVGASPATRGVQAALAGLQALGGPGSKFIVLITDGAPNCQEGAADDHALLEQADPQLAVVIGDALAQGIATAVVGIAIENVENPPVVDGEPDGVRPFAQLKQAAMAGGATESPWFHDAQDQLQLKAELEAIAAGAICRFPLGLEPYYADGVELTVGGVVYARTDRAGCATQDGWHYFDHDALILELCNQACADLVAGGEITARLRCPTD